MWIDREARFRGRAWISTNRRTHLANSVKTMIPSTLATLLLAVLGTMAAEPAQPGANTAPGPNAPRQRRQWAPSKAEWLDSDRAAPNGTQYRTFTSKVLGWEVSYLVWLPPGYEGGTKRYPVIYWLHGMGANQRGGAQMFVPQVAAAMKDGTLPPCIVVLVNGMVRSFYCDSSDGKIPMESVIIKDLIPNVDATYRTIATREGRVIEGYSMGGYGAAHLGFKYPELFGTVVINAGALLDPNVSNIPKDGPMFAVFGEDGARRVAEHPLTLAKANADRLRGRTHIRIGCGSLDSLLPRNAELQDLLTELHIEHDYEVVPGVAHESPVYYRKLGTKVYEFHRKSLAAPGTEAK
jgi:endo-1,4-beta-xylanase